MPNKTGFGFLRLPRLNADDEKSVDYTTLCAMVDRFLELGGDYFDTAYTYLGGVSEEAVRRTLVERHPRSCFRLADKLPGYMVKSPEDNRRFFETSLARCGVDYFDVYLLHGLNEENYEIAKKFEQFAFLQQLKDQGKARRIGFSYHDSPELLDRILRDHPEVDCVLLQINYLDWNSPAIRSQACYETAVRHGKTVLVMEPVKGGSLAHPPEEAARLLRDHAPNASPASWAIRFAADLPQVETVLSGMSAPEQIEDNMATHIPLTRQERDILAEAAGIIRAKTAVACTGCGYCTPGCPAGIPIPQYFSLYNEYARSPREDWKMEHVYSHLRRTFAPASACLSCGQCEQICPQHLPIPTHLGRLAKVFESNE